jgi:hypothetical protein
MAEQQLRSMFDHDENTCVDGIFARARALREAAARPPLEPNAVAADSDDGTCPISCERLHQHFTAVNAPSSSFAPMAPVGAQFRAALVRLPAATAGTELLTEAPTVDDIETQLQHVRGSSSPGLDGVGYDVYKAFISQLLPVLYAAFVCCWTYKRVPQSWKFGVVRLLF